MSIHRSTQSQTYTAPVGAAASFKVAATGTGQLTYKWRRVGGPNGGVLLNNGNIDGANTPTLTIAPAAIFANGTAFVCTVTNACSSSASDPAVLLLGPACPAGFNVDGEVNPDDLANFIGVTLGVGASERADSREGRGCGGGS